MWMFKALPMSDAESTSSGMRPDQRTGRSRSGVAFVMLAAAIAGLGFYFGNEFSQSVLGLSIPASAPLRVDPKHLDFGETLARSDFEMRVPITNASDTDIEVFDWDRSCGACTTVEPLTMTIPAGETREVLVRLDLALPRPATDLTRTREFNKSMGPRIRYADGREYAGPPMEWSLTGRVRDFVSADPAVVVCKEESIRAEAFAPFSINLGYGLDAQAVNANCSPELATVSVVQIDSRKWRLDVTPAPQGSSRFGEFRFAVEVTHATGSGEPLPPIAIPVTGSRVSDVVAEVLPSSVLGTHPVGTDLAFSIRLHSRTASPFEPELVTLDSSPLRVESIERQAGILEYHVSKDVAKRGLEKLAVRFNIRHDDGFEEESIARVFCIGTEP